MGILYDSLAVLSFIILCSIMDAETLSVIQTLIFGTLALAAVVIFVKLSDKYTVKRRAPPQKNNWRGKAA